MQFPGDRLHLAQGAVLAQAPKDHLPQEQLGPLDYMAAAAQVTLQRALLPRAHKASLL
jgi:hypothetical protein